MNDTIKYFCSKIFKHFLHPFPYFYLNLLLVPGCQWSEPQSSQSRRSGDLLCVSSHEQPLLLQHRLYHQARHEGYGGEGSKKHQNRRGDKHALRRDAPDLARSCSGISFRRDDSDFRAEL